MQSGSFTPGRIATLARGAEDVLCADNDLERGAPFCANPGCALHVRLADARVAGGGNWVRLPDGRVFGRGRYGGELLCDACGTRRGPVRLDSSAVLEPMAQPPVQYAERSARHTAEVRKVRDSRFGAGHAEEQLQ